MTTEETKKTNSRMGLFFSIACFLSSLLLLASVLVPFRLKSTGLFLYPIVFLFTFITGVIAFLSRICSRLFLGLAIIITFISVIYFYPFGYRFKQYVQATACQSNLNAIARAVSLYVQEYNAYPDTLQKLVDEKLINPSILYCSLPHEGDPLNGQYFYFPPTKLDSENSKIMVIDNTRHGEAYLVIHKNGYVGTYWFQKLIEELNQPKNHEFAKAWAEYIPDIK